MAFSVVVQMQLQAPANMGAVAAQISKGLSGISAQINLTLSPQAQAALQALNQRMAAVASGAGGVSSASAAAATSLANVGRAAVAANASVSTLAGSYSGLSRSLGTTNALLGSGAGYFERFGAAANAASQRFLAFTAGVTVFTSLIRGLREGVGAGIAFEREMNRIAQVSDATATEIGQVRTRIGELAQAYGVSSADLAKASVVLAQTGLAAKETTGHLEALALAAAAPNFGSWKDTVEGAVAVMRQFGTGVEGTREAIGSMNEVAAKFPVEAADLVTAVRKAGGSFAAAGGDLNQFIALFTSVRATTRESAEEISTGLRTIFARMQRADVIDELKALNVELRYTAEEAQAVGRVDLTNQFVGPYEAVKRLSAAIKDIPTTDPRFSSVVESLGGYRQISRVIPLLQQQAYAEKALGAAQTGSLSLYKSAERAQETLYTQTLKTKEQFLELFRTITESNAFQQFARGALSLANTFATVLEYAKPLVPLLLTMGSIQIFRGISGFFANAAAGPPALGSMTRARGMNQGGYVPGTGHGDTVPAMLEPNEFVLRQPSVKRLEKKYGRGFLDHLNRTGRVEGFADGGPVRMEEGGEPDHYGAHRMATHRRVLARSTSRNDRVIATLERAIAEGEDGPHFNMAASSFFRLSKEPGLARTVMADDPDERLRELGSRLDERKELRVRQYLHSLAIRRNLNLAQYVDPRLPLNYLHEADGVESPYASVESWRRSSAVHSSFSAHTQPAGTFFGISSLRDDVLTRPGGAGGYRHNLALAVGSQMKVPLLIPKEYPQLAAGASHYRAFATRYGSFASDVTAGLGRNPALLPAKTDDQLNDEFLGYALTGRFPIYDPHLRQEFLTTRGGMPSLGGGSRARGMRSSLRAMGPADLYLPELRRHVGGYNPYENDFVNDYGTGVAERANRLAMRTYVAPGGMRRFNFGGLLQRAVAGRELHPGVQDLVARLAGSKSGEGLLKNLPLPFGFLGAGMQGLALSLPGNRVGRLGMTGLEDDMLFTRRPNIEGLLQPLASFRTRAKKGLGLEILPRASMLDEMYEKGLIGSLGATQIMDRLSAQLESQGYQWLDQHVGNVGYHQGRPQVVDPGFIYPAGKMPRFAHGGPVRMEDGGLTFSHDYGPDYDRGRNRQVMRLIQSGLSDVLGTNFPGRYIPNAAGRLKAMYMPGPGTRARKAGLHQQEQFPFNTYGVGKSLADDGDIGGVLADLQLRRQLEARHYMNSMGQRHNIDLSWYMRGLDGKGAGRTEDLSWLHDPASSAGLHGLKHPFGTMSRYEFSPENFAGAPAISWNPRVFTRAGGLGGYKYNMPLGLAATVFDSHPDAGDLASRMGHHFQAYRKFDTRMFDSVWDMQPGARDALTAATKARAYYGQIGGYSYGSQGQPSGEVLQRELVAYYLTGKLPVFSPVAGRNVPFSPAASGGLDPRVAAVPRYRDLLAVRDELAESRRPGLSYLRKTLGPYDPSQQYALGGPVSPSFYAKGGSNEDRVPALVTPGEFLVRRESVERIGAPALHWMNQHGELPPNLLRKNGKKGEVHGYNKGGYVTPDGPQRLANGGEADKYLAMLQSGQIAVGDGESKSVDDILRRIARRQRLVRLGELQPDELANDAYQRVHRRLKAGNYDPAKQPFHKFLESEVRAQHHDEMRRRYLPVYATDEQGNVVRDPVTGKKVQARDEHGQKKYVRRENQVAQTAEGRDRDVGEEDAARVGSRQKEKALPKGEKQALNESPAQTHARLTALLGSQDVKGNKNAIKAAVMALTTLEERRPFRTKETGPLSGADAARAAKELVLPRLEAAMRDAATQAPAASAAASREAQARAVAMLTPSGAGSTTLASFLGRAGAVTTGDVANPVLTDTRSRMRAMLAARRGGQPVPAPASSGRLVSTSAATFGPGVGPFVPVPPPSISPAQSGSVPSGPMQVIPLTGLAGMQRASLTRAVLGGSSNWADMGVNGSRPNLPLLTGGFGGRPPITPPVALASPGPDPRRYGGSHAERAALAAMTASARPLSSRPGTLALPAGLDAVTGSSEPPGGGIPPLSVIPFGANPAARPLRLPARPGEPGLDPATLRYFQHAATITDPRRPAPPVPPIPEGANRGGRLLNLPRPATPEPSVRDLAIAAMMARAAMGQTPAAAPLSLAPLKGMDAVHGTPPADPLGNLRGMSMERAASASGDLPAQRDAGLPILLNDARQGRAEAARQERLRRNQGKVPARFPGERYDVLPVLESRAQARPDAYGLADEGLPPQPAVPLPLLVADARARQAQLDRQAVPVPLAGSQQRPAKSPRPFRLKEEEDRVDAALKRSQDDPARTPREANRAANRQAGNGDSLARYQALLRVVGQGDGTPGNPNGDVAKQALAQGMADPNLSAAQKARLAATYQKAGGTLTADQASQAPQGQRKLAQTGAQPPRSFDEIAQERARVESNRREKGLSEANGGVLSETTREQVREAALRKARNQVLAEATSAEERALRATNKGLGATEANRLAKERVGRVLEQEAQHARASAEARASGQAAPAAPAPLHGGFVRDAQGRILGTKDTVAAATAQGVNTPGAGGVGYMMGSVGRGLGGMFGKIGEWDQRANAWMQARGMNSFGTAFGLSMLAPYAGQAFQGDAAVSVEKGTQGWHTAGATTSGALQGAALGGMAGIYFGPAAAIFSAAAGSLIGGFTSFRDSVKELRSAAIEKSVQMLGDRLQVLASLGPQAPAGFESAALEQMLSIRSDTSKQAFDQSGIFSFDARKYATLNERGLRQNLGPAVPALTQTIQAVITQAIRDGVGRNKNGTVNADAVLGSARSNKFVAEAISSIAELQRLPTEQVENQFRPFIAQRGRQVAIEEQGKRAFAGESASASSFGALALSAQSAADGLRSLQASSRALAEAFEGSFQAGARVDINPGVLDRLGSSPSSPEVASVLGMIEKSGGANGKALAETARAADTLRRVAPSVLIEAGGRARGETDSDIDDFKSEVQSLLRKQVGEAGQNKYMDRAVDSFLSALDQMQSGDRRLMGMLSQIDVDVSGVVRKATEGTAAPAAQYGKAFLEPLLERANSFADGLANSRRQSEIIGAGRDRTAELELGLARTQTEIEGDRTYRPREAQASLSVSTMLSPLNARQSRLAQEAGLGAGAGLDPAALGTRFRELTNSIIEAQERQREALVGGDRDGFRRVTTSLDQMRGQATAASAALRNLTDSSQRVAVIQERLGQLRGDKEGRLGFVEKYLSSGFEERNQIQRGLVLGNQAWNKDKPSLDGLMPQDAALVISTMRSMGSSQLTGWKGAPAADDALRSMLSNSMGGIAQLAPGREAEMQRLQEQLLAEQRLAIQAQKEAIKSQASNQQRMLAELQKMFSEFFVGLDRSFQEDKVRQAENRLGSLSGDQRKNAGLVANRDVLRRAGIDSQKRFDLAQAQAAPLEEYGNAVAKRFQVERSYQEAIRSFETLQPEVVAERLGGSGNDGKERRSAFFTETAAKAGLPKQVGDMLANAEDDWLGLSGSQTRQQRGETVRQRFVQELQGRLDTSREIEGYPVYHSKRAGRDSGADATFMAAADTIGRLAKRLSGFDLSKLEDQFKTEAGVKEFTTALDAMTKSGLTFRGLDDRVAETARKFKELTVEIEALRKAVKPAATPASAPAIVNPYATGAVAPAGPSVANPYVGSAAPFQTARVGGVANPYLGPVAAAETARPAAGTDLVNPYAGPVVGFEPGRPGLRVPEGITVAPLPVGPRLPERIGDAPLLLNPPSEGKVAGELGGRYVAPSFVEGFVGPLSVGVGDAQHLGVKPPDEESLRELRLKRGFPGAGSARGYAAGGIVGLHPGEPKGVDRVPIWAADGEAVVPVASVRANRKLVDSLIRAKGPLHMADGGVVPGGTRFIFDDNGSVVDVVEDTSRERLRRKARYGGLTEDELRGKMSPFSPAGLAARKNSPTLGRDNYLHSLGLFRQRQLLAQSQNAYSPFGLTQADSRSSFAMMDRGIMGRQSAFEEAVSSNAESRTARKVFNSLTNRPSTFRHPAFIGGFAGRLPLRGFANGGLVTNSLAGAPLPAPAQEQNRPPQYLATGGLSGRDSVLAALEPGEWVVPSRTVSDVGISTLQGLSRRSAPAQASGGIQAPAGQAGPGISGEVLQALQRFGTVLGQGVDALRAAFSAFGDSVGQLKLAMSSFASSSGELAKALANFSGKLQVIGSQQVTVTIQGAEGLQVLQESLRKFAENIIRAQFAQMLKKTFPDVQVQE